MLTRTYGLFRIDSGMVDPEVALGLTWEVEGTIIGALLYSLVGDDSVFVVMTALFLIICGEVCNALFEDIPLFNLFITSIFVLDDEDGSLT